MKKLTFLFTLLSIFVFISCDDDDGNAPETTTEEFSVENKIYRLSSFILTEAVDLNGDGIYSFDLVEEEDPCSISFYKINFFEDKSRHPAWVSLSLQVDVNSNGILEQKSPCGVLDGISPNWQQNDNTIVFYYDTWESPDIVGELSDDGQQITFNAANNSGALFYRDILRADGSVIEYQDNIKLVYTLMEE